MYTSIISNFTSFFPLGVVFVILLGMGVAEGTSFMSAVLRKMVIITPKKALTASVVFLGIISNVASSVGYVVLVHSIAGLAATFTGVSGGWNANILIGTNDTMFAGLSTEAARILDPTYLVQPTGQTGILCLYLHLLSL